ncbi:MAG: S8 family serine peptidase [Planctomycetes bacterium]|nr:S8 family serine peptidase [Planctomycetota bacterium]
MSSIIQQELSARGVAQVLVFLRGAESGAAATAGAAAFAATGAAPARGSSSAGDLARHFRSSELSQASELGLAAGEGRALRAAVRSGVAKAGAGRGEVPQVRVYPRLGIMLGTASKEGIAALRADARVAKVTGAPTFSLIRPAAKAAAKLAAKTTWGIEAMKVPELWKNEGLRGEGVLVGHLDTGVDGAHPALRTAIAGFAEFDDLGREVTPAPKPFDTDDHGTHTAATIAGRAVSGRHVGVAPEAKLASAVVIEGGDVVARVLGGMDWSLGQGVRVLSMSLGFRGWWDDFVMLTRILRANRVLPVFAVGNEGPGTSRSPGNYVDALSVGAHDDASAVADFSSSQRFKRKKAAIVPDLVAPGVDVISAAPGGGWQSMDGTSMATPHVAGLAALLIQAEPTRSVAEVERAIFQSCKRPSGMPQQRGNRGIPDAVQALRVLRS